MTEIQKIALFNGKKIRKIIHENEWWFSIVDVCAVLTDSPDAGAYWRKLKQRLKEEGSEVVTFCHGLKLPAEDGKLRITDCANTEGIFRLIQSIPSPKAEPLKRWLAKIGYERIRKIEDPELTSKRIRTLSLTRHIFGGQRSCERVIFSASVGRALRVFGLLVWGRLVVCGEGTTY